MRPSESFTEYALTPSHSAAPRLRVAYGLDCPTNAYQNVKTQTSCISCPAGRWTNGLTKRISLDDCVPCPENWFSVGNRADCQKCPAGQSTAGFTGVTKCQNARCCAMCNRKCVQYRTVNSICGPYGALSAPRACRLPRGNVQRCWRQLHTYGHFTNWLLRGPGRHLLCA